jgi:hypothetical protein
LRYVITHVDIGLYAAKLRIIFESANKTKEKAYLFERLWEQAFDLLIIGKNQRPLPIES